MSDEKPIPERRRRAIALRYDTESDSAPRIVAKGQGYLADRIVELAQEHDIHIHRDPELAGVLSRLDIDTEIPETLYRAVAEVLAFVYRMNQRAAPSGPAGGNAR